MSVYDDEALLSAGKRVLAHEASALMKLQEGLDTAFTAALKTLYKTKGHIVLVGVGKSGHIARKIASTLSSIGCVAIYIHPNEASHGDLGMITPHDTIMALSKSGETSELGDLLAHAQALDLPIIALTSEPDSTLAKAARHALILPDIAEACSATQAPTTSTTMMLALGDAIAVTLSNWKGFTRDQFKRFHPGGQLGAHLLTVADIMRSIDETPLTQIGTPTAKALEIMSAKALGCIGILDTHNRLCGIITDGDLRRVIAQDRTLKSIEEAMTPQPLTISGDTKAYTALKVMTEKRITQLFVVDTGQNVLGIAHMHDFLRAGIY